MPTDTVEHLIFGTLPVTETWVDAYHTRTGWRAKRQNDGSAVDVVYDPDLLKYYRPGEEPIARLPENDVLISRDRAGHILGAVRIERRVRQVR